MESKILVLPGSRWQVELVKKIKEMNHRAYVVNPYENSPCFEFADEYLQSDIFDTDAVFDFVEKKQINAVMSDECDIAMPLLSRIAEKYNFSAMSSEISALYTDKYLMREFCREHGLKYPEYRYCKTADEAVELLEEIHHPIIIKPLDSNASKGVFKVTSKAEVLQHFGEALSYSRIEKAVLAERYIEGTEFTIDGIKTPSMHYTLGISEKVHFRHNKNIASELLFSHYSDKYDYDKLKKTNDMFVMNSGLKVGFTHAEYKLENGDFYLIEIGARGGGNMISSVITQYLSGYDTYKYLIDYAVGNIYDQDFSIKEAYKDRVAVLKFFHTPHGGGKVKAIDGLDVLENEPDIAEYMLNFKIGDTIEDAVSDSARIGFYIVCSENMDQLKSVINKVEQVFKIELE